MSRMLVYTVDILVWVCHGFEVVAYMGPIVI